MSFMILNDRYCKHDVSHISSYMKTNAHYYSFLRENETDHFERYNNGFEGARREGSCRCPYEVMGIPAPIPDEVFVHDTASTTSRLEHREQKVMKRTDKKDDFNTIVQLHKLMNDADNIDITS